MSQQNQDREPNPFPDGEASSSSEKEPRNPFRLIRSLVLIFLLAAVALVVLGLVIYQFRVPVLNRYLAHFNENFAVRVGSVHFLKRGEIRAGNVRVFAKRLKPMREFFSVKEMLVTYDWNDLKTNRQVDSVFLTKPKVSINEAAFDTLSAKRTEIGKGQKKASNLDLLSRITGKLEIIDGEFEVDFKSSPPIHGRWDLQCARLGFGEDGFSHAPFAANFQEIGFGENGEFGSIDSLECVLRANEDLSHVQVAKFYVTKPDVRITPDWFSHGEKGESSSESPSNRVQFGTQQGTVAIDVADFRLEDARFQITGFDGATPKAELLPDLTLQTSLLNWKNITYRDGEFDTAGPIDFDLDNLVVGGGRVNLVEAKKLQVSAESLNSVLDDFTIDLARGEEVDFVISNDSLSRWREAAEREDKPERKPLQVKKVVLDRGRFLMENYVSKKSGRVYPRISSKVDAELTDVSFDRNGMHSSKVQTAKWRDFILHGPETAAEKEPILEFASADLGLHWDDYIKYSKVRTLKITRPVVRLTDEALGSWTDPVDPVKRPYGPVNRPVFRFYDLDVTGGTLLANTRKALDGMLPKLQGGFSLKNDQIGQGPKELGYRLTIKNLQLSNHPGEDGSSAGNSLLPTSILPGGTPLRSQEVVKVGEALIDFTDYGIQRQRRIKKVTLKGGVLRLGEGIKGVVKKNAASSDALDLTESDPPLSIDEIALLSEESPDPEVAESDGSGESEQSGKPDGDPSSRQAVPVSTSSSKTSPALVASPVLRAVPAANEAIVAEPVLLAQNKPKGKEKDPNQTAPKKDSLFPAPGDPPNRAKAPFWQIEDLEIIDSKVSFEALFPQLEGLTFGLESNLKNIPLTLEGLRKATQNQTVKLKGIEIRDPYDSFLTVALLPDVYIDFTVAGLSQKQIDRIEIVGPVLNVGESLFRWVDYLRTYRAINEGSTIGLRLKEESKKKQPDAENGDAPEEEAGPSKPPEPEKWVFNTINATNGKLVIAPYGTPVTSLPFPFSAETNIEEGKLRTAMRIDESQSVMTIPAYNVQLSGIKGRIDFNLPIPEVNNNLVQTFEAKQVKWKRLQASNLFLSVTFDRYGIYGIFGGEAYGGYANGAFNYYLNKNGLWDGWLTGTELNTGELTKALIPGSFAMGGKINLKLFSGGTDADISGVTGELQTVDDGWFDIVQMEKILDKLPENWNSLQKGLAKISVDSLKRFDYHKGTGQVSLKGRDGLVKLRFEGDYGSRVLNLHIHDWRNQTGSALAKRNP